jgi:LysM repeat protein
MENTDSNIKPQSTGGLKLMTVFIVVLALHVVVIGGFTVYHLMSGGGADADLLADKNHKAAKTNADGSVATDGQLPDGTQPDKSATASTDASTDTTTDTTTDAAGAPANAQTAPPDQTASTDNSAPPPIVAPPAPAPAPAPTPAPAPVANTAPTQPAPASNDLAPPPDIVAPPAVTSETASGPVKMPQTQPAAETAPVSGEVYVVKITDSYYKIAHRHHITVAALKAANSVKTNVLHVGQKLIIPGRTEVASANGATPAPAPETPETTALMGEPAATAPLGAPAPEKIKPATDTASTMAPLHHHLYTVVKGDTLIKIARKFKTTANAIMIANNISDPTKLGIGKKLKIPSREANSAGNAGPAQAQPGQAKAGTPAGQLANFVQ